MMVWFDRENNTGKMAIGGGQVASKTKDYINVGLTLIIAIGLILILIVLSVMRSRRIADEEWLDKNKSELYGNSNYNEDENFGILIEYMK